MTKVWLELKDNRLVLRVEGHADRSETEDVNLCCAGISMLVQTAIATAQDYEKADMLKELHIENAGGMANIILEAHEWAADRISGMNDMLHIGFELLVEAYPGRITWGEKQN